MLKKKDYPKELRIGDSVYRVKFVSYLRGYTKKGKLEVLYGVCDPSTLEIFISRRLDLEETFKTFVHEVLHAIEFEYDIELKHSLIGKLEQPIFEFLRDNVLSR